MQTKVVNLGDTGAERRLEKPNGSVVGSVVGSAFEPPIAKLAARIDERHYYIGQLAADLGVNPKTIRYYEEIGLLPNPQRSPKGYRVYGAADRERLHFIVRARGVGLSLEEIAEILAVRSGGQQPCDHVIALLDKKLAALDEQLRALTNFRRGVLELREEAQNTRLLPACVCGIIEHHTIPILQ